MKILFFLLFLTIHFSLQAASNSAAGAFAGGFADGFNKAQGNSRQELAQELVIIQMRQNFKAKYGTKEIERLDFFIKNVELRLYEIFDELPQKE